MSRSAIRRRVPHEGTDSVVEAATGQLADLGGMIVDPVRASSLPFSGDLELEPLRSGLRAS